MKGLISGCFAWIGVVVGVLSAANAINSLFEVGITGFFLALLQYYRDLVDPIRILADNIGIKISDLAMDIMLFYGVLLSMSLRAGFFPLFEEEVFSTISTSEASIYQETLYREPENMPSNMRSATLHPDGRFVMELYKFRPKWHIFAKHLLSSLLLIPIITLSPIRKIYNYRSKHFDIFGLAWHAKRPTEEPSFIEYEHDKGHGYVNARFLLVIKSYIFTAIQTIAIPISLVIFFILAKY